MMHLPKTSIKFAWNICLSVVVMNFALLLLSTNILVDLTNEDGIVENASAIFLLLSSIFFALSYVLSKSQQLHGYQRMRNLVFLLLAILFFVAMGEEISWGQRIFNIETPDSLKEINYQEEINLHNLNIFEGRNPDGSQKGGFAAIFTSHRLFYLFLLGWTLLIPLAFRFSSSAHSFLVKIGFPVPNIKIGLLVAGILVLSRTIKALPHDPSEHFGHATAEISELNLAIAVAYTGFAFWQQLKQGSE